MLKGDQFGAWVFVEVVSKTHSNCVCTLCDKIYEVNTKNLKYGHTVKCRSCASKESAKKHGAADKHPIYSIWKGMRARCNNENLPAYKDYGGRGIGYCERWEDFTNFAEDMFTSYIPGLTLERIDVNGSYCPENCKWATRKEQNNNQRKSLCLLFNGSSYTESELSELTGVPRTTIQARRNKGATVEEMVYGFV